MSTLRDDFAGGSFNTTLFAKTETFGTVTQTGGELVFAGGGGAGICYVNDQTAVDISAGDDFAIKMAGTTPAWPARFWLAFLDAAGVGIAIRFGGTGVNLFHVGTCTTGIGSFSALSNFGDYDVAVHTYLRVRYASGTGFFEYKTNAGDSWTTRTSTAMPGGFDPTTAKGWFGQFESDAAGTYTVTEYYAPTLSGGGGSSAVPNVPAVFGLNTRLCEIEEDDLYRRSLGSFILSGVTFLSAPLRPILKVFGYDQRVRQETELDDQRNRVAFRRTKATVLGAAPTAPPEYTFARVFGLQARQALEEEIDLERSKRAFGISKPKIFPNNQNTIPRFRQALIFGLANRLAEIEADNQSRATSYFRRSEAVTPIIPPTTTPKNNIFWWLRRFRR
jgi:hypothetical protein